MKKKKVLTCFLALSIVLSVPFGVSAQEANPVEAEVFALSGSEDSGKQPAQPRWDSQSRVECNLSASGKTLTATVRVMPKTSGVSTSGTLYIERKEGNGWVQVASTSVSGTGLVIATKTYTGTSGKTYRARYSGTTGSDSVSSTSTEVTVY